MVRFPVETVQFPVSEVLATARTAARKMAAETKAEVIASAPGVSMPEDDGAAAVPPPWQLAMEEAELRHARKYAELTAELEKMRQLCEQLQKENSELQAVRTENRKLQSRLDKMAVPQPKRKRPTINGSPGRPTKKPVEQEDANSERMEVEEVSQVAPLAEASSAATEAPPAAAPTTEDNGGNEEATAALPASATEKAEAATALPGAENEDGALGKRQEQEQEMQEDPAPAAAPTEERRIPPIVLHNKADYVTAYKYMARLGLGFKATNLEDGIRIQLDTAEAYRMVIRFCIEKKIPQHSHRLRSEKNLKVVLKGIPETMSCAAVAAALEQAGMHPVKVSEMWKTKKRQEVRLPMVMVELPREERQVYRLNSLYHLKITVEELRRPKEVGQCYRCQRYGHAQSRCTGRPVCVRCGEDHRASECKRPREEPARCGNCQGPHPANYRNCPRRPKPKATPGAPGRSGQRPAQGRPAQAAPAKAAPAAARTPAARTSEGRTFAQAAAAPRQQKQTAERQPRDNKTQASQQKATTTQARTAEEVLVAKLLEALQPALLKTLAGLVSQTSAQK